jgi:hypothetical protein
MMKMHFRSRAPWLVTLALTLLAAPAFAQVPQDMTYTGRLVDGLGDPLASPVNLELRVFDAETGPTQLYSEEHLGVVLDATGGFSVQLGLGTSPSGTFDVALFSGVDRWLEVVVGAEVLTPRQVIGSVPWALVAEQANEIVRDPNAPRFEDCGDGTVADHRTGLQWEKKTGTLGSVVDCDVVSCLDPHNVNNIYGWTDTDFEPTGSAFRAFLDRLNPDPGWGATSAEANGDPAADPTVCFAHHCDWHLPAIGELRTILVGSDAAPGQPDTCSSTPCIDPEFAAVGGPTASSDYWSASSWSFTVTFAWVADFGGDGAPGNVIFTPKDIANSVRAVRGGSCN